MGNNDKIVNNQSWEEFRILIEEEKCLEKMTPKNIDQGKERDRDQDFDEKNIEERVLKEINDEERDLDGVNIFDSIIKDQNYLENQGISMNQEGLNNPKCGKGKMKRGRKSLKELRKIIGQAKDQKMIIEIMNTGKGKNIPIDQ